MNNILLPLDVTRAEVGLIDFACYMADLTDSVLTGAFIQNFVNECTPVLRQLTSTKYEEQSLCMKSSRINYDAYYFEDSITLFKETCRKKGVRYEVCELSSYDILPKSRLYDLIIIDPQMSVEINFYEAPSKIIRNLLMDVECPVITATGNYRRINEIIHCYNGSNAAAFAIKQFTYLFPKLRYLKCTLLEMNSINEWQQKKMNEMEQWLKLHYSQCSFEMLMGEAESALYEYLATRSDVFVTMGACGRNAPGRSQKEGSSTGLIRKSDAPIFIFA